MRELLHQTIHSLLRLSKSESKRKYRSIDSSRPPHLLNSILYIGAIDMYISAAMASNLPHCFLTKVERIRIAFFVLHRLITITLFANAYSAVTSWTTSLRLPSRVCLALMCRSSVTNAKRPSIAQLSLMTATIHHNSGTLQEVKFRQIQTLLDLGYGLPFLYHLPQLKGLGFMGIRRDVIPHVFGLWCQSHSIWSEVEQFSVWTRGVMKCKPFIDKP